MSVLDWLSVGLLGLAGFFFVAGTAGLLRFPDVHTRLHAVTKVDNLGLGCTVAALVLQADAWLAAGEMLVIWLLALAASASGSYLVAAATPALEDEER